MENLKIILALFLFIPIHAFSQIEIQNVGLKNQSITSLKFWYGIMAVGADKNGVYWCQFELPDLVSWTHIDLPGKNIRTVYPHKSGPIGWSIGVGIRPEDGDTNFVYCCFMGGEPKSINTGIDRNLTSEISKLDGFPDPTICGETFAAGNRILYRRYFTDTVWYPVYNLSIEGNFTTVNVRLNYPTVIAGGGEGFANHLLIKSMDKGDTWEDISALINVQSLDFTDDSAKVIFVTDNSKILKSNDYGSTWNEVFNNNNQFIINKLRYYPDLNTIFAVGTTDWDTGRAVIYYNDISTDQWNKLPINILNPIVDIDYGPDNWIYIATADSGVYRIRNLVVNVEDEKLEIPNQFSLSQNYPNPFNPTTTIEYTIPSVADANFTHYTKLVIYDILGKEIENLINKNQNPGNYQIVFDASNLPSGIYYYQLKAGSFVQTKKMILLK